MFKIACQQVSVNSHAVASWVPQSMGCLFLCMLTHLGLQSASVVLVGDPLLVQHPFNVWCFSLHYSKSNPVSKQTILAASVNLVTDFLLVWALLFQTPVFSSCYVTVMENFLVGCCLYGVGIRLQMLHILESILSTALNGSLRNINTWRVSVSNRTLWRDCLGIGPQKLGTQKLPIFDDFAS